MCSDRGLDLSEIESSISHVNFMILIEPTPDTTLKCLLDKKDTEFVRYEDFAPNL